MSKRRAYANLPECRDRVARVAEMIAREEGLGDVVVYVEVASERRGGYSMRVEIVDGRHVDATDVRFDEARGGPWEDN